MQSHESIQQPRLGVFDSGVGGFSVLKEIRKKTAADIFYFGDCARAPYGNRKEEEIVDFIKDIVVTLKQKGVTHFISACNSMSVLTTEKLLEEVGIEKERYIDMVDAFEMISFPEDAQVFLIGTQATIRSATYQSILEKKNISFEVFSPMSLALHIENGNKEGVSESVDTVLSLALQTGSTHIVYVCTHYPLVDAIFKESAQKMSWPGTFIDPSHHVAEKVQEWNLEGGEGSTLFESSLATDVFKKYVDTYEDL